MKVAISWTGGKDSALACIKAQKSHEVALFVNFRWDKPSLSHPMAIAKLQSEAVNKPFLWERVQDPYLESYRLSILYLKNKCGIDAIVTGDITVDAFHGKWIDEVCKDTGVQVIKPLWEKDRTTLMEDLLESKLKVTLTCVKEPWFTEDWLGRTIDEKCYQDLQELHKKNGVDICGEFGEYHTMVMDAPFFTKTIHMPSFTKMKTENGFIMEPTGLSLKPKPA
ncbi:MAG: diphthine--ammonia ligase [Candidatus Bathyarchaeota archaeon]|nr:diphthine--ammonia ligase [Candidatus Bathyarchaeota archaeon]